VRYTVPMASEIEVNNKKYVASKIAAKESGYTQDYIGQLARAGEIRAERSGGLWYVDMDSVGAHKVNAAKNVSKPPRANTGTHKADSVVTFDGKEYVSSRRGAKITGYNQDYVTQLARSEKISSRQIGNRWYVSKNELTANKKHNDALLASVQSESVGFKKENVEIRGDFNDPNPILSYFSDEKDLIPSVPQKVKEKEAETRFEDQEAYSNKIHNIPINVSNLLHNSSINRDLVKKNEISVSKHVLNLDEILDEKLPERNTAGMRYALASAALTTILVLIIGVGMFLPSNSSFTRSQNLNLPTSKETIRQTASAIIATIQDYTQGILGGGLQYKR
jgi:hypothetical protein